jgi:hypothetical protein
MSYTCAVNGVRKTHDLVVIGRSVLVALTLAVIANPCLAEHAPPRAGRGVPEITRDWWLGASNDQRETFVRASIFGYQAGRNDAENPGGESEFSKPASYYVSQISRFYGVAPSALQSMSPSAVLLCLPDGGPAPKRALLCGPVLAALGNV